MYLRHVHSIVLLETIACGQNFGYELSVSVEILKCVLLNVALAFDPNSYLRYSHLDWLSRIDVASTIAVWIMLALVSEVGLLSLINETHRSLHHKLKADCLREAIMSLHLVLALRVGHLKHLCK